jgi:hypothetical protein
MDKRFIFYDIEALPKDFSVVSYLAEKKQLIVYTHTKSALNERVFTERISRRFGKDVPVDSPYHDLIDKVSFVKGAKAYYAMRQWLLFGGSTDGLLRGGWNSKHFDLPVLIANIDGSARSARILTEEIIEQRVRATDLTYSDGSIIRRKDMNYVLNAEWSIDIATLNEKSGDVDDKQRTPASLKMVSGYAGLDVLDDEITRIDFNQWSDEYYANLDIDAKANINPDKSLTEMGLVNLLEYNTLDVINTGLLFDLPEYHYSYDTKQALIERFNINDRDFKQASPSDSSARISSLALTGGDRTTFTDKPCVTFDFPMPDGSTINLLERLHETKIIPPIVYKYYKTFEGRSIKSREDSAQLLKDLDEVLSPEVHVVQGVDVTDLPKEPANAYDHASKHTNATITVPYFDKDLNPIPSYNTFSRGGSHGGTSYNATEFTFEDARMMKFSLVKNETKTAFSKVKYDNDIMKRTTDTTAWAIDVGSFYPSFLALLKVYATENGDVYNDIRVERLELKESLPALKKDYTAEDKANNKKQTDSKLILNSVSGASNTMSQYALLPLDNSILSMRLMGNLFIYMIATNFVRHLGAHVVSTNTDGIEITFDHLETQPSEEQIFELAEDLTEEWGFDLEPEHLTRFVAKDSNNRIEWHGDVINKVGGKLGKGFNADYTDGKPNRIRLDSKLDHPQVTDLAVLAFIDAHKDYLRPDFKVLERKPATTRKEAITGTPEVMTWLKNWLLDYADGKYHNIAFNPTDWALFTKGTRSRKFYMDGLPMQDNNRYVYVTNDNPDKHFITSEMKGKPTVITNWTSNRVKLLNTRAELLAVTPDELDIEAYTTWAYDTLVIWVNGNQRTDQQATTKKNLAPKLVKLDPTVQLDIFDLADDNPLSAFM